MDVYEAIAGRRTIRDFSSKPVSRDIIEKIVQAGLQAPSNDHLRRWEFVLVNDEETRRRTIAGINQRLTARDAERVIDKWGLTDQFQREMYIDAIPKQYRMLLLAPCLIIPCFRQEAPLLKPKSLSDLNGFASIWCCIENMLLAAAAEGVYGVTRIPFDRETPLLRKALGIPEEYAIPCYLALGHPRDDRPVIRQHEIRSSDRIHQDRW